jgi:hypothetical protein
MLLSTPPLFDSKITIYAPMIYTAPCLMFWMRAYPLRGQEEGGVGPGILKFFGPTPSHLPK